MFKIRFHGFMTALEDYFPSDCGSNGDSAVFTPIIVSVFAWDSDSPTNKPLSHIRVGLFVRSTSLVPAAAHRF